AKPAELKGLKIGLMLEAGCGVPPAPDVRVAVERAAGDFAGAGAHVEPLAPGGLPRLQPDRGDAQGRDRRDRRFRLRALADGADNRLSGGMGLAQPRSAEPVPPY